MPALIESFASRAVPAWHNLGTVFDASEGVNTDKMVTLAGLDWTVGLESLVTDGESPLAANAFATVRTNTDGTRQVLGVVGDRYTVVQNHEALRFADNILDGGGRWETAGAIKDGAVVFGSLAVLDDIVLDPQGANDVISNYLLVSTSHDGSSAVQVTATPVRVVCQNTLNAALIGAKNRVKFRHTSSIQGRVLHARQALGMATGYADAFETEARALFETSITDTKFEEIVKAIFPQPEADAAKVAVTKWDNRFAELVDLYNGPTVANVRGTAWGAVQALTEQNQWYRNVRSGNVENALAAGSGFDDVSNNFRTKVFQATKALA